MADPKTPTQTRGWETIEEFEVVADGVMRRVERRAVGPTEWDFNPREDQDR